MPTYKAIAPVGASRHMDEMTLSCGGFEFFVIAFPRPNRIADFYADYGRRV